MTCLGVKASQLVDLVGIAVIKKIVKSPGCKDQSVMSVYVYANI